ncbi:MAG: TPM domain-containing protein [candidate division NC10 bacterium]|nr:TPM domain-containing protein [candidate division NC10 bacterium]
MDVLAAFRRPPFLTATEREQVEAGLATARRHAGAPIGLVIDDQPAGDPAVRARQLFREWDLPEAERPAAVLVYACAATRRFAVVGGEAIRRVAPQAFWDALDRDLTRHFDEGRYCDGLFKAVAQVAIQLQHHFPRGSPPSTDGPPNSG